MSISIFTSLLKFIAFMFSRAPMIWVLAMAILCAIAETIRYIIGGWNRG